MSNKGMTKEDWRVKEARQLFSKVVISALINREGESTGVEDDELKEIFLLARKVTDTTFKAYPDGSSNSPQGDQLPF